MEELLASSNLDGERLQINQTGARESKELVAIVNVSRDINEEVGEVVMIVIEST